MRAWPILVLAPMLALPATADALPEVAQMRGPGFGCAAPFLLHAADPARRDAMAEDPPPFRRAMLTCLAEPGMRKRPLHQT
jgi:hypothetical protein